METTAMKRAAPMTTAPNLVRWIPIKRKARRADAKNNHMALKTEVSKEYDMTTLRGSLLAFPCFIFLLQQSAFVNLVFGDDILDVVVLEKEMLLSIDDDHRDLVGEREVVELLVLSLVDGAGSVLRLRVPLEVDLHDIALLDVMDGGADGDDGLVRVEASVHLPCIEDETVHVRVLVSNISLRGGNDAGEERLDLVNLE